MKDVNERLRHALVRGGMNEIRRLVEEEGANPRALVSGTSALHLACFHNHFAILQYFVEERNADVRVRDYFGQTLLHDACRGRTSFEIVKYLVETGCIDIDAETMFKRTALHYACTDGSRIVAMYLVEKGANVNVQDKEHRNGLDYAVEIVMRRRRERSLNDSDSSDDDSDSLDLIRFLIPRTRIRLGFFDKKVWRRCWIPWDVKELLIKTFAKQHLDVSSDYVELFPLHTVLRVRFPLHIIMIAISKSRLHTSLLSLDPDGRLPIHLAFDGEPLNPRNEVIRRPVIFSLLELEPRSTFARDPKTGFFPFESAACALSRGSHPEILELIYRLFRCNPSRLLTSRGFGNGYSIVENVREGKRRKTMKNASSWALWRMGRIRRMIGGQDQIAGPCSTGL